MGAVCAGTVGGGVGCALADDADAVDGVDDASVEKRVERLVGVKQIAGAFSEAARAVARSRHLAGGEAQRDSAALRRVS